MQSDLPLKLLGIIPIFTLSSNYSNLSTSIGQAFVSKVVHPILESPQPEIPKDPMVYLPNLGTLIGARVPGYESDYEAFVGVPFAEPPVGNLRFANPKPIRPWKDPIMAKEEKPVCIQKNYLLGLTSPIIGEEDCLYLNIYRPPNADNLPVMVYIHGGAFAAGDNGRGFAGPDFFMDTKRVVLVAIAYRLGALGFLSTNDSSMPGNFGLKDQRLALRFVKNNIQYFGGDHDNITIFGQSAGGASVHMHILSAGSRNYFNQAILMSGSALAPYNEPVKDPLQQAIEQAKYLGIAYYDRMDTALLTQRLREVSAKKIVEAGDRFKYWQIDPVVVFKCVIEPPNVVDPFLTQHPYDIAVSGGYRQVPLMNTFVPNEAAIRTLLITENPETLNEFNLNFNFLLTKLLEIPADDDFFNLKRIVSHYMKVSQITPASKPKFEQIITDYAFYFPMYETIKHYFRKATLPDGNLFLVKFNYKGPYSYSHLITQNKDDHGVVHCDDLIYLFRTHFMEDKGWAPFEHNSEDHRVVKKYVNIFVWFAEKKFQEIQACKIKDFVDAEHYYFGTCKYTEISNNPKGRGSQKKVIQLFNIESMHLWENLVDEMQIH